ncbi:7 transmembrane receptor [Onchocerca flexuosa]|uniref:7 transmembrane receptor n=1 Tax=Onchocerca flexuosa TaxID=387005 RepID=A0A238BYJ1_9BILA|nr:7 transmembrane receptor [Onchocerca flexuosa]
MMTSSIMLDVATKMTTTTTAITTTVTTAVIRSVSSLDGATTVPNSFDETVAVAIICLLIGLMIVATLVGNSLVIMAVLLVRKLKIQPANYLFVSLAIADFCVGLLVMPIALIDLLNNRWILGGMVCRFWTSADLTLCTASIVNLCMISIDRYCAVSQPLRYVAQRTQQRIFCYVIIVWILSLVVSISPLVIWPAKNIEGKCQVNQNPVYQIYATLIAFYGPTCIMIILYAKMWLAAKRLAARDRMLIIGTDGSINGTNLTNKLHSSANLSDPLNQNHYQHHHYDRPSAILQKISVVHINKFQEKSEGKARKTLGIMMSVFVICWLPFFLLALLKPQGLLPPRWLDHLALWLGYSNSLMNPLIYCKHNREFRIPIREMLCCRFRTLHSVMRRESFTSKYGPSR